jgi:Serine dehydrogenase proteinase
MAETVTAASPIPEGDIILVKYQKERMLIRQSIIKQIEDTFSKQDGGQKTRLISYSNLFDGPVSSGIEGSDIEAFSDILTPISESGCDSLILMISSPGGEAHAAEKIFEFIRKKFRKFRVIVPQAAKSAATMIALGSDEIIMCEDISELGPIDPQIPKILPTGAVTYIPAYSIINLLTEAEERIEEKRPYQHLLPILANVDADLVDRCNKSIEESKALAKEWLKTYMLKKCSPRKIARIVDDFTSPNRRFKTHSKLISASDAKEIGLRIKILPANDELWKKIWELHRRTTLCLQEGSRPPMYSIKIFETSTNSITKQLQLMVKG